MTKIERIEMHKSVAETVTGTNPATSFEGMTTPSGMTDVAIYVNVTAASGTTPTLDLQILSIDMSVATLAFNIAQEFDWFDAAGAPVALVSNQLHFTTTGSVRGRLKAGYRLIDAVFSLKWTIGGTTPSFTFTVGAVFKADSDR